MTFRVGQKVQCVDTWHLNGLGFGDEVGPVAGSVYTIREIGMGLNPQYPDHLEVRLVEIVNLVHQYRVGEYEAAFCVRRFRPLTDISIFTAMLKPSKVTA